MSQAILVGLIAGVSFISSVLTLLTTDWRRLPGRGLAARGGIAGLLLTLGLGATVVSVRSATSSTPRTSTAPPVETTSTGPKVVEGSVIATPTTATVATTTPLPTATSTPEPIARRERDGPVRETQLRRTRIEDDRGERIPHLEVVSKNAVVIGRVSTTVVKEDDPALQQLITATMTLRFEVFDATGARIAASTLSARGGQFTEDAARVQAQERLAEKLDAYLRDSGAAQ